MKNITTFLIILFSAFFLSNCTVKNISEEITTYKDTENASGNLSLKIDARKGDASNHPSFVIWMEDLSGTFIRTLFITQSYASGIFGHQMVGDSVWLRTSGESYQPAALPYWTYRKGKFKNELLVPTPEFPYTDGYTGATPKGDMNLFSTADIELPFRVLMEVNQPWDWNKYWTNNKYPENDAYKHSAQPSLVYAVTINDDHDSFYMNLIGHGDPKGESGKLFTDLKGFDSAKTIFESVEITIKK